MGSPRMAEDTTTINVDAGGIVSMGKVVVNGVDLMAKLTELEARIATLDEVTRTQADEYQAWLDNTS